MFFWISRKISLISHRTAVSSFGTPFKGAGPFDYCQVDMRGSLGTGETGRSVPFPTESGRRARVSQHAGIPRLPLATDEQLFARLGDGDREALGVLFDRYARLVLRIGLRTLHDNGEAEDLVQDVFLELYEKAKKFDANRGSARTWLIQIAYRRAFDRRAYLSRRGFYNGTEMTGWRNTYEGAGVLEEQIDSRVSGEQIRAAFAGLSESQRLTLQMYFFEGLNFREISARMGESLENTRHYYYRGLERLRRAVAVVAPQSEKVVP